MFEAPVANVVMFTNVVGTSTTTSSAIVPPPAPQPSADEFCD